MLLPHALLPSSSQEESVKAGSWKARQHQGKYADVEENIDMH